jgi:peptide deformylase
MPLYEVSIVPLDAIPEAPYKTPSEDLHRMCCTAKGMESLCLKLHGMGLAAAQVGLPWRMFVFRDEESRFQCYFDCEYYPSGSKSTSVEGCLSLPGEHYKVDRYEKVTVKGMRIVETSGETSAEPFEREYSGVMAVLMQHEIDHDHGRERMIDKIGTRVFVG